MKNNEIMKEIFVFKFLIFVLDQYTIDDPIGPYNTTVYHNGFVTII